MNPLSYLIMGCGHFGSQAIEKLLRKNPHAKITVVDRNKKALERVPPFPAEAIVGEGIAYLRQDLKGGGQIDYVIPAVPLHVAFEFVLAQLRPFGARRAKIPSLHGLPSPMIGRTGDLYTSLADFLCPDDCPEPSDYCTVTGQKRQKPLYKILVSLEGPFESKVIRSEQLGLGIGGFRAKVLLQLTEEIRKRRSSERLVLISTACRCHGVTSALSF